MNSEYSNIYPIPTGYLFTSNSSKGSVETLSIGDYGKAHNVKANFLGYNRDINGVPNTHCMPLSDKWVVTISTQVGCKMLCRFCSCHEVEWGGNLSMLDLHNQFELARNLFPKVKYTERLNLHFARMGEPIFNYNVFSWARYMKEQKKNVQKELDLRVEVFHPVLTTSLPKKFGPLRERIMEWCDIKNNLYDGQAGFQFSINSTNEEQREDMFRGLSLSLKDFAKIAEDMPTPLSRKYCLNFALASNYEVDARLLSLLFDKDKFMVKITPIHNNHTCKQNGIETIGGYETFEPYKRAEDDLLEEGLDVLVFIPSMDEEDGLVTCGNAILGGDVLKHNENDVVKIEGIENSAN